MQMPDVTKIQVVAIVQAVIALGLALGLNIDAATQASIIGAATALSSFLVASDAVIRHGRSRVLGTEGGAEAVKQLPPPA